MCAHISLDQISNHNYRIPVVYISTSSTMDRSSADSVVVPEPLFTAFNRLPKELSLEIWKFATRVPRVVPITTTVTRKHGDFFFTYKGSCKVPSALHCSRESHEVSLKAYALAFRSHLLRWSISISTLAQFTCKMNSPCLSSLDLDRMQMMVPWTLYHDWSISW